MYKLNSSIPSNSDVRNFVFHEKFVKLLSDVNFELCKIVQLNPKKKITLFSKSSYKRKLRKIATIINRIMYLSK